MGKGRSRVVSKLGLYLGTIGRLMQTARCNSDGGEYYQQQDADFDKREKVVEQDAAPPREGVNEARKDGDGDGEAPNSTRGKRVGGGVWVRRL